MSIKSMPRKGAEMDASVNQIAALRRAIADGAYDVDRWQVAGAIVRRLAEGDPSIDLVEGRPTIGYEEPKASPRSRLSLASPSPSPEEVARAQLNRYAIDLKKSYERELQRTEELKERTVATVHALANAVAERDDDTGNHIQRVHDLGLLLARTVVPAEADDPEMGHGFILHDIGKVAVPDAVLLKRGPLSDAEWEIMKTHAEAGARMLEPLPFLSRAREVVLHHHERWDGRGYPHGLAGEEIPMWARIFAVADTVDAMTSERPYRAGLPLEAAFAEVADQAGAQFDPRCVEALLALDRRTVASLLQPAQENRLALTRVA
jgi:HD-GYP domain-containing protein (c-di-GMP phosphodiesterase class II)